MESVTRAPRLYDYAASANCYKVRVYRLAKADLAPAILDALDRL